MFCCAPPNIRKLFLFRDNTAKYHKLRTKPGLCIVYDYDVFRKNAAYLPKLHEHKIQEEPNFVINDPSSIFYDPEEKSGFVYRTSESLEDINSDIDKVRGHSMSLDSSLNLDDSLDLIPNMAQNLAEASFDQEYGIQCSRRGSSELIDSCDEATYHDYHQMDANNTPVNLLLSTAQTFKSSEMRNLRTYEDSGYGSGGQRQKKDYNSDAESTNKYQDSGIYEDDVFSDSPKHSSLAKVESESFIHDVEFEMDDFLPEHSERNTAFKTPSSSPLKLVPTSPIPKALGTEEEQIGRLRRLLSQERDDIPIISACVEYLKHDNDKEDADSSLLLNARSSVSKQIVRRPSDKYSHIQAKVQTRRTSSISPGRSSSPTSKSTSAFGRKTTTATTAKVKSDQTYKPMYFGRPKIENVKTEFRRKAKSKVGSMANVGHIAGGGQKKIFKQKLDFRKNAESKVDAHGIEMYSHLPQEFQEIARRLSRQDHQLKLNARQSARGRASSRSTSTVASSRASSASPKRGRSKTRNRPPTPSLPLQKITHSSSSPNRQGCLSRSSSIRSIPTTPTLHTKHPATSTVLYDKKCRSRNSSPSSSRVHSPIHSCCSSRAASPTGGKSRSKSRSRPGTPRGGESQPATPIRQLYQFTQAHTFIPGSPKSSGSQPLFQYVPVR